MVVTKDGQRVVLYCTPEEAALIEEATRDAATQVGEGSLTSLQKSSELYMIADRLKEVIL